MWYTSQSYQFEGQKMLHIRVREMDEDDTSMVFLEQNHFLLLHVLSHRCAQVQEGSFHLMPNNQDETYVRPPPFVLQLRFHFSYNFERSQMLLDAVMKGSVEFQLPNFLTVECFYTSNNFHHNTVVVVKWITVT